MPQFIDTAPRIERPDDFYQMLIDAHNGLDDDASAMVNAKLVLLLSNHIGDMDVLGEAIEFARAGIDPSDTKEVSK